MFGATQSSLPSLSGGGLFGASTAPAATPAPANFGLGSNLSTGLGTTSVAGGLSFSGLTATTAAAPFSTSFLSTSVTSTKPSLNFATGNLPTLSTAPLTSTPLLGGTLGAPSTFGTSTGFNFQSSSLSIQQSSLTLGTGLNPTVTLNPPANLGLGGVDLKATTGNKDVSSTAGKTAKEAQVPNEINQVIEEFKKYVKGQQTVKEEIRKMSSKELFKVQEETTALKQQLATTSGNLQRYAILVEKLRQDTALELKNSELAHRIKDSPVGLHGDYTAALDYFQRMINQFENNMLVYRQQVELLEKHVSSVVRPSTCTPQEVIVVIKRLHDTFVALAAHMQGLHDNVLSLREQYLQYRKINFADTSNLFDTSTLSASLLQTGHKIPVTVGPNPFTGSTNATAIAMASAFNRSQQSAGAPPTFGLASVPGSTGNLGTSTLGSMGTGTGTLLGLGSHARPTSLAQESSSFFSNSSAFSPNKTFQLQKPPVSSKRGKR